jgi:hypothetical protein
VSSFNDSFGGIEAVASLELDFRGCSCNIRLSRLSKLPNYYRIVGEQGTLEGGVYDGRKVTLVSSTGARQVFSSTNDDDNFQEVAKRLVRNFLGTIDGNTSPLVPARDVVKTLELIDEAYRNAQRFPMPWYEPHEVHHVS